MSIRRVLVAVDAEPVAAHAADVGIELARSLKAQVALLTAIPPPSAYAADTGIAPAELVAAAEREGKRLLAEFRQNLSLPPDSLEFIAVGRASEQIVKAAKDWPADLIVIGSHGRAGLQRALLGSVAEGVIRHAPCPVLVVRAPQ
jgi:universal stress protein A